MESFAGQPFQRTTKGYKTIPIVNVCQSVVALAVVFVLSLIFPLLNHDIIVLSLQA